jgi:hypothetical protein
LSGFTSRGKSRFAARERIGLKIFFLRRFSGADRFSFSQERMNPISIIIDDIVADSLGAIAAS